jgi:hypothetical protein
MSEQKTVRKVYKRQEVNDMILTIKKAKENPGEKSQREYYLLETYQILEISGVERLIKKIKDNAPNEILIIVPYEDLFDEINQVHIQGGHAGIKKMTEALSEKFDNIQHKFFELLQPIM